MKRNEKMEGPTPCWRSRQMDMETKGDMKVLSLEMAYRDPTRELLRKWTTGLQKGVLSSEPKENTEFHV
jgi:hypothetical protein